MGSPVVIFFGITNLFATFQSMINKILKDMINEKKVIAFVDNVLVGTETKKGYCGKVNKFRGESGLRVLWLKVKEIYIYIYIFCVMSHSCIL